MGTYGGPDIVTDGLVFLMDAANKNSYPGSGTAINDLTANNTNGTLTNGPVFNSGKAGSIEFDAANDFILLPGASSLSVNYHTISSWNYSSNYNQYGFLFEKTTNGSVNTQYSLFLHPNTIYYRTYGLSWVNVTLSATNLTNNAWNNITVTYDGSNKKIYINGVLKITSAVTGTVTQNTTGTSIIGAYGTGQAYFFNGKIAQTAIYNKALTADEILQNYNVTKKRFI